MADTQVRMANHIHEKVKAIAGKRNVSIKEIYEEALTRYIEAEAQEEILRETHIGVSSGKCGFTTLRAFSPLIPRVYRLFIYLMAYVVL